MHISKHKNVQAHFVLFAYAWLNCKKNKNTVDKSWYMLYSLMVKYFDYQTN